ncbi:hypothetical protein EVAR_37496_1 [Eumeta japonica]|uniref:Uncharacterized protein n=1 Tax=Eumeta variegata TaxID=151549 RepID=A0A4C1XBJ1_EUMVA|nr:hypothetical protein EVAR_37496_1 [Eumeta japonica]
MDTTLNEIAYPEIQVARAYYENTVHKRANLAAAPTQRRVRPRAPRRLLPAPAACAPRPHPPVSKPAACVLCI